MIFDSPAICQLETHVTLDVTHHDLLPQAAQWAADQGLKWTHIVLADGQHPSQPMVTFWQTGTLRQSLDKAQAISKALDELQLRVVRVKVECESADAPHVLQNRTQLSDHLGYFEHHVKLRLDGDGSLAALEAIARRYDARLSSNARRTLCDGKVERFVTQRAYQSDRAEATDRLGVLIEALRDASYLILEVEEEYVLYDSHLQLDAGWL